MNCTTTLYLHPMALRNFTSISSSAERNLFASIGLPKMWVYWLTIHSSASNVCTTPIIFCILSSGPDLSLWQEFKYRTAKWNNSESILHSSVAFSWCLNCNCLITTRKIFSTWSKAARNSSKLEIFYRKEKMLKTKHMGSLQLYTWRVLISSPMHACMHICYNKNYREFDLQSCLKQHCVLEYHMELDPSQCYRSNFVFANKSSET